MDYTSPISWGPEIILILGDLWIPDKRSELPKKFAEILKPGKITSVICTGNLINEDTYDWLRTISTDLVIVKGEGDTFAKVTQDYQVKEIGGVKIGVVNGYQLKSLEKNDILSSHEGFKDCGVIIYGSTHKNSFEFDQKEGRLFLNPGSCTGLVDKEGNPTTPSCFILCPTVDAKDSSKVTGLVLFRYELQNDEVVVSKEIVINENFPMN